jgi:hypothetical protein
MRDRHFQLTIYRYPLSIKYQERKYLPQSLKEITSIKELIAPSFDLKKATDDEIKQKQLQRFDLPLKPLAQYEGNVTSQEQIVILFSLKDYLQLVDTTGRMIRTDKRGAIPINLPPILERLSINRQQWLQQSQQFEKLYASQFSKKRRT